MPKEPGYLHRSARAKKLPRRESESVRCNEGRHALCHGVVKRNHGLLLQCDCKCHKKGASAVELVAKPEAPAVEDHSEPQTPSSQPEKESIEDDIAAK